MREIFVFGGLDRNLALHGATILRIVDPEKG